MSERSKIAMYLRNLVFGIEDSLVSTVGLLAGLAAAGAPRETLILTGIVLISVEALSMAAGSFLSEESAKEYESKHAISYRYALAGACIMFASYIVAGLFPLLPYLILSGTEALAASVMLSLILLGALGTYHGKIADVSAVRSAFRMVLIGGAAIALGVFIGQLFGV